MGSVLVVEADPGIGADWSRALGSAGHEVLAVADVHAAMAAVREGGLDVIVLDSYDGQAQRDGVMELMRSLDLLPDAPPVILVSGSPTAPELSARIGAAGFVPKPCDPDELVAEVQRITVAQPTSRPSISLSGFDAEPAVLARGTDPAAPALPRRAPIADAIADDFRHDFRSDDFDDEPTGPVQRRPELL